MHSSFARDLMLTTSPAQTNIAHGAHTFNYGKQGLPGLPTRLVRRRASLTNTKKSVRGSSTKTGSVTSSRVQTPPPPLMTDSSEGRIGTSKQKNKQRRKIPCRPFKEKDNLLVDCEDEDEDDHEMSVAIKQLLIPVTLSRRSSRSTTSSVSSTSEVVTSQSKKVVVIKKKMKRQKNIVKKTNKGSSRSSTPFQSVQHNHKEEKDDRHLQIQHIFSKKGLRPKSSGGGSSKVVCENGKEREEDDKFNGEDEENDEDGRELRILMNGSANSARLATTEKVPSVALPLLKQRLGYLWENKMFTDVIFLVGRNHQKIETHRVILASCSQVFQNLLYGEGKPLMSSDGKYMLYEDEFSEDSFQVFIKAMYTNEIPICLTLAMALEVFYATKKYAVLFLEDQVLDHIRQLLTVSNVFEALRFSTNAVELTYLAPICWRIVEERTWEVLEYHLEDLETHLFVRILERDKLSLEEAELFQLAVRWAANMCKTHDMKTTGKNKRHFMEPLLKHFRFTTMSPNQFNEIVVPSRILDQREIKQIQYAFTKGIDQKSLALPYKTTPRVNTASAPTTAGGRPESRAASAKNISNNQNCLDGSGDHCGVNEQQQQIQLICSDSSVVSPKGKKGTSSMKLKTRRVPSSSQYHPKNVR